MAKYDDSGLRMPTTIFECAAWHKQVVVTCLVCQRRAVFDPHQIWWLCRRKGWEERLAAFRLRFKCNGCGQKRAQIGTSGTETPTVVLPWPDEREWKKAVSRFRS
ncbi:hypothetical protein ACLB0R_01305 [Sphingomonas sp. GlSt437]|uniref:hypothetical protein n=1 Tax=Sphingomonas sp. GlSt437 TaxID=3389970 RepID=UPI003EB6FCD4